MVTRPPASDPSAAQPTPAPIGEPLRPVSELPEDAIDAAAKAIERTVRGFTTRPNFFGQPTSWGATSEQLADAALAAALPFLDRATRSGTVVPDSALLALETAWSDIPDLTEAARGTERAQVIALDSALDAFFASLAAARVARGGEATE